MSPANNKRLSFSVSLVTQNKRTFFTLTMPIQTLAKTCFVSRREEDPVKGFQRYLDRNRALDIANYIDQGGTIPNSIVLSAQTEAALVASSHNKTIQFNGTPKAFLILDGQHRVYGFSMATASLRVPVVIYNGLSRRDETRLFIDINTKQRPVPNELLLDIKQLAEYETDAEQRLREMFDLFNSSPDSPLIGLMSPNRRQTKKISRVTFNTALKPLMSLFGEHDTKNTYEAVNSYVSAFVEGMHLTDSANKLTDSTVFRSIMLLFPDIAQRVQDRHGAEYTKDNFWEILEPMFSRIKASVFIDHGRSAAEMKDAYTKCLKADFLL